MIRSLKFHKTASSQLQYKINMSIIFNYMRQYGPITRAKLSRDLNISAPAVSRAIEKLLGESYVVETGKAKSKTGKKPMLLKTNDSKGLVIGIDLARGRVRCMLANFSGESIKSLWGSAIGDSKDILDKLSDDIAQLAGDDCIGLVKTVCIGVPAVVDDESGRILSAPLYGSWKNLDIGGYINKKLGIPVYIENNVNLAALAEKNYGQGQKFNDVFFLEIGNGIGGGIIIDNHLLRGSEGSAGEVGFSIVNQENIGFKVKNKGFLEKHASVTSLQKKAVRAIKNGSDTSIKKLTGGDTAKVTPAIVCEAALSGDDLANNIIEEMNRLLAVIIINTIFLLNPQIIVIGGDICALPHAKSLFINPITKFVKGSVPFRIPPLKLSLLGEDAGVIGSSFMAMEAMLVGEFPYKIAQEVLA